MTTDRPDTFPYTVPILLGSGWVREVVTLVGSHWNSITGTGDRQTRGSRGTPIDSLSVDRSGRRLLKGYK